LKNSSSKSIIFCPFNTPHKQEEMSRILSPLDFKELLADKRVLKYGVQTRAINREYEKFNNIDFDNGVYHKFAYTNQPKVERATAKDKIQQR